MKNKIIFVLSSFLIFFIAMSAYQWKYSRSISPQRINDLNRDLNDFFALPDSVEKLEDQAKVISAFIKLDNQQYITKFLDMAFLCHNDMFSKDVIEIIVNSENPTVLKNFEKRVDKSFSALPPVMEIYYYVPYVYINKKPKELLPFMEKLSKKEPNWHVHFYRFDSNCLIDLKKAESKELDLRKAKDYYTAIKECPSDYAVHLMESSN